MALTQNDLPLFPATDPLEPRVREGLHLKADGLAATEESNCAFVQAMREEAHRINKRKGRVSIDDLRLYADANGMAPKSPHAWGSIFHQKGWRVVGHAPSTFPSNRSREIREWTFDGN